MKIFRSFFMFIMLLSISNTSFGFDNTNILVEEAVNHIYQKRYKQAYNTLKKAYEQSPRHPGVHFNLGRLFELTGNFKEALKEYKIAASLDTTMIAARRGIARCIVELKRRRMAYIKNNKHKKIESDNKLSSAPIVTIAPRTTPKIQNKIGRISKIQTQEQLKPIKTTFTEPKLPPLPLRTIKQAYKQNGENEAETLLNNGKIKKAVKLLQNILKKNSNSPKAHYLMGKALYIQGNLFDSIKHLEEAVRVDSNYYEAYLLLGKTYEKVNLLDDALKNYKIYYAVHPQSKVALNIAKIYDKMNKPEAAQKYYKLSNITNPGNPALEQELAYNTTRVANNIYFKANYEFSKKNYKKAIQLFKQALMTKGLKNIYKNDALQKLQEAQINQSKIAQLKKQSELGKIRSRRIYGTTDLKYYELTDINAQTKFTGPITVEWRAYVAKRFTRYGRDFLLMIKELTRDELDIMNKDKNDYKLNNHYNNQPVFLITAPKGKIPKFIKEGKIITFTGKTDWKQYSVLTPYGDTINLPAFRFISAFE